MEFVKYVISAVISFAALFGLTKILGNRQMSQLSMFDYVGSVALGSIAGELAVMSSGEMLGPLVAMITFTALTFIISFLTCKSIILRRFFEGHAVLLYQQGQIYEKNLLRAKMDIDELLANCRINGYFDLEEIHTIYLESNGEISIIPRAAYRPLQPSDLNIEVSPEFPMANVIIDGNIMSKNLQATGKDAKWVDKQLRDKGISNIKDVILATYDQNNDKLNIYLKYKKPNNIDIFE